MCNTAADTTAVNPKSSWKESPKARQLWVVVARLRSPRRTPRPAESTPVPVPAPGWGRWAAGRPHLRGAHQPQELLLPLLVAEVRRLPAAGALREHTLTAPARPERPLRPAAALLGGRGLPASRRGLLRRRAAALPPPPAPPTPSRRAAAPRPVTSGEAARLRPWWLWDSLAELMAADG